MIKATNEIFDIARERIDYYQDILSKVEENPLLILKDLYIERSPDSLFAYLVLNLPEEGLTNMQSYLYSLLIPKLRDFLSIEGLEFKYKSEEYPSQITVMLNEQELVDIDIYTRTVMVLQNKNILTGEKERESLIKEREGLVEQVTHLESCRTNPLQMGGANPIKLAEIALRKSKVLDNLNSQIQSLSESIYQVDREISSINTAIGHYRDEFIEAEYYQEKIVNKLKNRYSYSIIKEGEYDEEDV